MHYNVQELTNKKTLKTRQKDLGEIPAGHVLAKTKAAGICGSDLEYYRHGHCGAFVPQGPIVLGHEFSGEVAGIGTDVKNLSLGDAVVIDPSMPCGHCSYCRTGNYHFCINMKFLGSASCFPHIDGGFAEYVVVPAANASIFDLAKMNWQTAALVEPLMVALAAVSKIENLPFHSVAVFGGGTIGQLILDVLKAWGAKAITLIDPRKFAQQLAYDKGIATCLTPESIKEQRFDVCIEAAGHPNALLQCLHCVDKRGLLIQVGTISEEVPLPVNQIMSKELTIRGSFRYANLFQPALDLLEKLDFSYIITQTVSLNDLQKGFEILLDPNIHTLKVQVRF